MLFILILVTAVEEIVVEWVYMVNVNVNANGGYQ